MERFVYASLLAVVRPESATGSTKSASESSGLTIKTITWGDDRYRGQTKDGKPHGRGVLTWSNGNRYEGDFVDGKRTGTGVYTSDGERYEGGYRDDKFHGHGVQTWSYGEYGGAYEGEWRDGEMHGRTTYTLLDGDRYMQEWKDGALISKDVHKPSSTCLSVKRSRRALSSWVNRCSVGIDVLWRDDGACRSRAGKKYPCSSFVGANDNATATLEGKIWWNECESPGGLGHVVAIEKHDAIEKTLEVSCLTYATPQTLAHKKELRRDTQQLTQQAEENQRLLEEMWRQWEEEDEEEEERQRRRARRSGQA